MARRNRLTEPAGLSAAEEFLLAEEAAGKAPPTLRNRRQALSRLARWCAQEGVSDLEVTPDGLRRYLAGLRARVSDGQVNLEVAALRRYFRFLQAEGLRSENPAAGLRFLPVAMKPPQALPEEQVRRLLRACQRVRARERFGTQRAAALTLLLLDTGLRVGEAVRLRVTDLHLGENGDGRLLVRAPKTKSFRVVALTPTLRVYLVGRYLRFRARRLAHLGRHSDLLFVSEQGGPLSVDRAEDGVRCLGRRALGEEAKLHPHLLRHTWATLSLSNGAPLPAVMKLGGWRKLETVQRYTQFTDSQALAVHQATSPLAALGRGRPARPELETTP